VTLILQVTLLMLLAGKLDFCNASVSQRPKLEKVDKDQKDGVVALELEKIAGSSGRF
ncbi:hypothetical protein Tco_1288931, partial [Tanacetum coccineum]